MAETLTLAAGFTVKSGWAAAVLIGLSHDRLLVIDSQRIQISDPAIADAKQPYHGGFGTARGAGDELKRLVASVKSYGRRSIGAWLQSGAKRGKIRGVGIVVGSLIDPARIANDHIRIHALEGQLFRGVVIDAAEKAGYRCSLHRERDLFVEAEERLHERERAIRAALAQLGKDVIGAWRAEQKLATLAARLELS